MCIAFLTKKNAVISDEHLKNSSETNKDGFGFAWIENKKLKIYKTLKFKEFLPAYHAVVKRVPESVKLVHLRKKTEGKISEDNCHPFKISDSSCFVHNGTIMNVDAEKDDSDTNAFNQEILQKLPKNWKRNEALIELVENYIGSSKIITLDSDGYYLILNERDGNWMKDNRIWASNWSYYSGITSLQKAKPTVTQKHYTTNNNFPGYSGYSGYGNQSGLPDTSQGDWECWSCRKVNWYWHDKCTCGVFEVSPHNEHNKEIVWESKTCPECSLVQNGKLFNNCKKCNTPLVETEKGAKEMCTYCGKAHIISFRTNFSGRAISLCGRCCFTLRNNSDDLYFPCYLFREQLLLEGGN